MNLRHLRNLVSCDQSRRRRQPVRNRSRARSAAGASSPRVAEPGELPGRPGQPACKTGRVTHAAWEVRMADTFCGIDVAGTELVLATAPLHPLVTVANTERGCAQLVAACAALTPTLIVLEASGRLSGRGSGRVGHGRLARRRRQTAASPGLRQSVGPLGQNRRDRRSGLGGVCRPCAAHTAGPPRRGHARPGRAGYAAAPADRDARRRAPARALGTARHSRQSSRAHSLAGAAGHARRP